MRKTMLGAIAVAVLAIGSTALAGSGAVQITSTGFNPANVSVQSGDSVNWTNADKVGHQVDVAGSSCKLSLEAGQSGSCAFQTAGTFAYSDPTAKGFAGTVTVAPNSRSVTLAISRSLNIFGDAVTLSGTVSSKAARRARDHRFFTGRPAGDGDDRYDHGRWELEPAGPAAGQDDLPGKVRYSLERAGDGVDPPADHAAKDRPAPVPDRRPVRQLDGR
jgi:plastocyanin